MKNVTSVSEIETEHEYLYKPWSESLYLLCIKPPIFYFCRNFSNLDCALLGPIFYFCRNFSNSDCALLGPGWRQRARVVRQHWRQLILRRPLYYPPAAGRFFYFGSIFVIIFLVVCHKLPFLSLILILKLMLRYPELIYYTSAAAFRYISL